MNTVQRSPSRAGCLEASARLGEFALDADAQLLRLLFQERAGAGGAGFVHGEIDDDAFFQADELRILAADLEDGIDRLHAELLADVGGAGLVGRDLVVDRVGADQFADQFAAAAGGADAADVEPVADLLLDLLQPGGDHLDGAALRAQVDLVEQFAVVVDDHQVGGDRADVDAQIGFHLLARRGQGRILHLIAQQHDAAPWRADR